MREQLTEQIERAFNKTREECLQPSTRTNQGLRVLFAITYHPTLPSLNKITHSRHQILHVSQRTKRAFPQCPIIAYRCPKNLHDLLVRAELPPLTSTPPGNTPCGQARYKTCPILLTTASFASRSIGHSHQIKTAPTCKSSNLVYLIQCQKCGIQYVGETAQAHNQRMNSHRSDISNKAKDKPVAIHFNRSFHQRPLGNCY